MFMNGRIGASCTVIVAVALLCAPADSVAGDPVGRFEGAYEYAGSTKQGKQTIERAIEKVTDEMGILKDGIAKDRLDEALDVLPRIVISVHDDEVSVEFQGITYRSVLGGPWVSEVSPKGEKIQVQHRMKNGKLVQEIRTKNGRRVNVFTMQRAKQMQISVIVSSPKLPNDIRYKLNYRRKG